MVGEVVAERVLVEVLVHVVESGLVLVLELVLVLGFGGVVACVLVDDDVVRVGLADRVPRRPGGPALFGGPRSGSLAVAGGPWRQQAAKGRGGGRSEGV
ncbi:hypothetical protein ACQPX6_19825 [Actinomycetospora sp. CA-101289]|uniref:hypothetical protein n=1 Tax=Actinomycetospora sp. CA-101289 TaxID=3239893 RepID=UPI003D98AE71